MNVLNFEQTKIAIRIALLANIPIALEGPPGIGKSAIMAMIAREMGVPLSTLILSLCDPTDVGGALSTNPGARRVDRLPLGPIADASEGARMLFLDELSTCTPPVQAASMRLILDRVAGDIALHPDTRIVTAYNPTDQAAGGFDLALPLLGRITVIKMRPTMAEVQTYFADGFGAPAGSTLATLGADWSATLETTPAMLQIEPPPGAQSEGTLWGAPRNWERALRSMASALDLGLNDQDPIVRGMMAGSVGEECAGAYLAVRKIRDRLPSISAIVADPKGAQLPGDTSVASAVPGLLASVAIHDPCSALVYATRLDPEIQMVSARVLIGKSIEGFKASKFYGDATRARVRLLGLTGKASAGVV